eukprot:m.264352 g.264352  ORF g.264352 m.264352 type:complete len:499 (-) comp22772_c1_seq8:243-1739(-)
MLRTRSAASAAQWALRRLSTVERHIPTVRFDQHGNRRVLQMPRQDLVSHFGLSPRDVRAIDGTVVNMKPQIKVRESCIVVCLNHAKVIVAADQVLQLDYEGLWGNQLCDLLHRSLVDNSRRTLRPAPESSDQPPQSDQLAADSDSFSMDQDDVIKRKNLETMMHWERIHDSDLVDCDSDFELRALEAVLVSVVMHLDINLHRLSSAIENLLFELSENVSFGALERLLPLKTSLNSFEVLVFETSGALRDILDDDEIMTNMRLTLKKKQGQLSRDDHTQTELLLESYFHTVDEIHNETKQLSANIKGTEEILAMTADYTRNRIMSLNLFAAAGAFIISTGALVTGAFGMNLDIPAAFESFRLLQLSPFASVCLSVGGFCAVTGIAFHRYYARHGRFASQNVRGFSVSKELLPFADDIEEEIFLRNYEGQALKYSEFASVITQAMGQERFKPGELESLFKVYDPNDSGRVDTDKLLAILQGQQHAFRRRTDRRTTKGTFL